MTPGSCFAEVEHVPPPRFTGVLTAPHVVATPPAATGLRGDGLDDEDLEAEEEDEDEPGLFCSFLFVLVLTSPVPVAGQKRGRRASFIHNHCAKDGDFLVCQVPVKRSVNGQRVEVACGVRLKYLTGEKKTKSPKSMTDHLAHVHNITATSMGNKQAGLARDPTGKVKLNVVQKWSVLDGRTANVVDVIAKWFGVDGLAPNNVSKMGFRAAFEYLHPEFPGVTPPTVFERIREYAAGFVEWFQAFQNSVDWFAFTTDGWSDDAHHHYRTLTAHFMIPNTWKMVAMVLKTAECGGMDHEIADFVLDVVRQYKMLSDKVVAVTSDNASAEVAGLALTGFFRIPCGCHLLNLTMKLALDEGKPATARKPARAPSPVLLQLKKLTAIVNKLHNAPLFMGEFKSIVSEEARRRGLAVPNTPMQDVVTRWNSTSFMIDSCLMVRNSLDAAVRKCPQYDLTPMTTDDWMVIKQVGDLLRPFRPLSKFAEGAKYATVPDYLGQFWLIAYEVFYKGGNEQLLPCVATLKNSMRVDFGIRLHKNKNDMTLAGLALHPT